jgi:hypothetical protein
MYNTIYVTFLFSILLAIMLYTGLVKVVKFNFNKEPVTNTLIQEQPQQTQSEKAAEIQEKNRRLMERVREQMEKRKR